MNSVILSKHCGSTWKCYRDRDRGGDARFRESGDADGFGIIQDPGTINLSMSLGKSFAITERVRFKIDGSFTNLPNHVNLADPVLNLTNPAFGRITSARGAEFGGSRTGQVSARLEF